MIFANRKRHIQASQREGYRKLVTLPPIVPMDAGPELGISKVEYREPGQMARLRVC